jgi:hypothetical protein
MHCHSLKDSEDWLDKGPARVLQANQPETAECTVGASSLSPSPELSPDRLTPALLVLGIRSLAEFGNPERPLVQSVLYHRDGLVRKLSFPLDFQGTTVAHRTPRKSGCSASGPTLSPYDTIPGSSQVLTRKENSSRGNGRRLQVQLRRRKNIRIQIQEY